MARPRKHQPKRHTRRHGEGSIIQVGPTSWRAYAPAPKGQRRPNKTFRSELEAQHWLSRQLEPEANLAQMRGPAQPFGAYLEQWLDSLMIGPQTVSGYRRAVLYAKPLWKHPLNSLTKRDFQALFADWMRESPHVRRDGQHRKGLSVGAVRTLRNILAIALNAAMPDLLVVNPIRGTRLPSVGRKDVPHWDQADAQKFLRYAVDSPLYAFFRIALGTGARTGEIRALKWSDLNLDAGTMLIRRNLSLNGKVELPTKTRREREVAVPPPVIAAIRRHRAAQTVVSEWVFCDDQGKPLNNMPVNREYWRIRALAGVPKMVLYGLRHTAASLALIAWTPLPEVSEMLGHANTDVTARIYWRALASQRGRAAKALAEALP